MAGTVAGSDATTVADDDAVAAAVDATNSYPASVAANAASSTADSYDAAVKMVAIGDTACDCNAESVPMAAAAAVVTPIVTATWNGVQLSEKDRLAFMDMCQTMIDSMNARTLSMQAETE